MTTPDTFYALLPQKRMGAGCLFLNQAQHLLLVKPTYKPTWEIPGGIVEKNESPKHCCKREVFEELGLKTEIGRLLVIDYNEADDHKTESLMFIFWGGVLSPSDIETIQLAKDELHCFAFFAPHHLPKPITPTLKQRIQMAWQQAYKEGTTYLENQQAA